MSYFLTVFTVKTAALQTTFFCYVEQQSGFHVLHETVYETPVLLKIITNDNKMNNKSFFKSVWI